MNLKTITLPDLACLIQKTLQDSGINAVLVGGACVSIYSENLYQSSDLDFATYEDMKPIEKALCTLGFTRIGRQFSHPDCPFFIDFVNPPISVGHEAIHEFHNLKTPTGSLRLLTPTDCVKDRLASYFHWNDRAALEQALMVARNHAINLQNIHEWASKEGFANKYTDFVKRLD